MKIKDIEKKYEEANEKLVQAKKLRDEALALAKEYGQKAEESALGGDVDQFVEYKTKASKQEAFAYVQDKQIQRIKESQVVTKEETIEAWIDFSKEYSRQMKNEIEKYKSEKAKLIKKYLDLVAMQENACKTREKLASYIGRKLQPLTLDGGLDSLYPMEYIPYVGRGVDPAPGKVALQGTSVSDPDAVFYLTTLNIKSPLEMAKSPEAQRVNNVVAWRRTE